MKRTVERTAMLALMVLALAIALPGAAQEREREGAGDRGAEREREDDRRGGDRENWRERWESMSEEERAEMRQRMEQRRAEFEQRRAEEMRERLEMSEAEFEVVGPMIDKVRNLLRERESATRTGRGGFRGGTAEMSKEGRALSEASAALRQAVEDNDSSDMKTALVKLRESRAAMNAAVAGARAELLSVCTPKMEAAFVLMGVLE